MGGRWEGGRWGGGSWGGGSWGGKKVSLPGFWMLQSWGFERRQKRVEEGALFSFLLQWGAALQLCLIERKNGPLIVFLHFQRPGLQKQIHHYNTNMWKKTKIPDTITRNRLTGRGLTCREACVSSLGVHSRGWTLTYQSRLSPLCQRGERPDTPPRECHTRA